jgi:hypothetical protein
MRLQCDASLSFELAESRAHRHATEAEQRREMVLGETFARAEEAPFDSSPNDVHGPVLSGPIPLLRRLDERPQIVSGDRSWLGVSIVTHVCNLM